MAENRNERRKAIASPAAGVSCSAEGHPSVQQLMAEQGTGPITDVSALHSDFWPEEEPNEAFLEALHEWRGRKRTDPAA